MFKTLCYPSFHLSLSFALSVSFDHTITTIQDKLDVHQSWLTSHWHFRLVNENDDQGIILRPSHIFGGISLPITTLRYGVASTAFALYSSLAILSSVSPETRGLCTFTPVRWQAMPRRARATYWTERDGGHRFKHLDWSFSSSCTVAILTDHYVQLKLLSWPWVTLTSRTRSCSFERHWSRWWNGANIWQQWYYPLKRVMSLIFKSWTSVSIFFGSVGL